MRRNERLVGLALLALLATVPAAAGETDQYLAWGASLADSSGELNRYLNDGIRTTLERLDRPEPRRCEELPPRIYRFLFHGLLRSRLRHFLDQDPAIDRHPGEEVRYFGYLRSSVFRDPAFPFLMPMSRTIRIGGVHLGIDKINHMFGFGRRYYRRYLRARQRGLNDEEALREVVVWGLEVERHFVGGMLDGIVSFADLEANYQGMRLARDLCEADPPHLELEDGRWVLRRPVDVRDYVNPRFDESYNENQYIWWRWRQVRPVLESEVCPRLAEPEVQALWRRYRLADNPSRSEQILRQHIPQRRRERRSRQSVIAVCPPELVNDLGRPRQPRLAGR